LRFAKTNHFFGRWARNFALEIAFSATKTQTGHIKEANQQYDMGEKQC